MHLLVKRNFVALVIFTFGISKFKPTYIFAVLSLFVSRFGRTLLSTHFNLDYGACCWFISFLVHFLMEYASSSSLRFRNLISRERFLK